MSERPVIASNIQTVPMLIDRESVAILGIGASTAETIDRFEDVCRKQCDLGAKACTLEVILAADQDGQASIQANCQDCVNPNNPVDAVKALIDFADRRKAAIDQVEMVGLSAHETDDTATFFQLVKDPEQGDYHVISYESLQSIRPEADKGRIASRILTCLSKSNFAEKKQYSRVFIKSEKLKAELNSKMPFFLVAEGMTALLDSDNGLNFIPNFGKLCLEVLEDAQRKTISAGIAQESLPAPTAEDVILDDYYPEIKQTTLTNLRNIGIKNLHELRGLSSQQIAELEEILPGIKTDITKILFKYSALYAK